MHHRVGRGELCVHGRCSALVSGLEHLGRLGCGRQVRLMRGRGWAALLGLVTPTNGASIVVAPIGAVVALPGFLASSWSLRLLSFAGLTVNVGLIALAVWWVRTYGGI